MRHTVLAIAAALLLLTACEGGSQETADSPEVTEPGDAAPPEGEETDIPVEGPEGEPEAGAPPAAAEQTPWSGPGDDEIGADIGFEPILFEGEDAVVAVTGMTVYDQGADVRVAVRERPEEIDQQTLGQDPLGIGPGPGSAPDPDDPEVLRLTITYPDGQAASSVEEPHGQQGLAAGGEPDSPILISGTAQSTPGAWDYELWLWPLPGQDDGALEISAEWPAQGIEGTAELDSQRIGDAADSAVELWGG